MTCSWELSPRSPPDAECSPVLEWLVGRATYSFISPVSWASLLTRVNVQWLCASPRSRHTCHRLRCCNWQLLAEFAGVDRSLRDWIRAQNTALVMTASLSPFLAWTSTSCHHPEASQAAPIEVQTVSWSRVAVFVIGAGVLDLRGKLRQQQRMGWSRPVVNAIVEALEDLEERQRGCLGLCHHCVRQHGVHTMLASSLTRSFFANSQDVVESDLMFWH